MKKIIMKINKNKNNKMIILNRFNNKIKNKMFIRRNNYKINKIYNMNNKNKILNNNKIILKIKN